jgi:hypothetical protein
MWGKFMAEIEADLTNRTKKGNLKKASSEMLIEWMAEAWGNL